MFELFNFNFVVEIFTIISIKIDQFMEEKKHKYLCVYLFLLYSIVFILFFFRCQTIVKLELSPSYFVFSKSNDITVLTF